MATCSFELKHEDILKLKLTGVLDKRYVTILSSATNILVFDANQDFIQLRVMTNDKGLKYLMLNTSKSDLELDFYGDTTRTIGKSCELRSNVFKDILLTVTNDESHSGIKFKGYKFDRYILDDDISIDGDIIINVVADSRKGQIKIYNEMFRDIFGEFEISGRGIFKE